MAVETCANRALKVRPALYWAGTHTEVPDVVELLGDEHGDHPAEGGGERGADGGARGGGGVALGSDGEGRARVEAVPWGEGEGVTRGGWGAVRGAEGRMRRTQV